jgi:hypothetical protein
MAFLTYACSRNFQVDWELGFYPPLPIFVKVFINKDLSPKYSKVRS